MGKASKFTDEQKLEIVLELLTGKLSHAEACRKSALDYLTPSELAAAHNTLAAA